MSKQPLARRSFLSRLGIGAAAIGAAGARPVAAQTAPPAAAWQPARHAEDDWFDAVSAKHKLFLDTTSVDALGSAIFYANNYYSASRNAYGLSDQESALVIGVRHESTPFAFNDQMWTKYGAALSEHAGGFKDPKTRETPVINLYLASGYGAQLPNRGVTLDADTARGLRLSVCQLATRAIANVAAQKSGGKLDDIYKELVDNRVKNAHMVPAGIVALSRAQERGYTFGYVHR